MLTSACSGCCPVEAMDLVHATMHEDPHVAVSESYSVVTEEPPWLITRGTEGICNLWMLLVGTAVLSRKAHDGRRSSIHHCICNSRIASGGRSMGPIIETQSR